MRDIKQLAAEARALEVDEEDRAEMLDVAAFMDSLRPSEDLLLDPD